jgi:hypothetical protein
MENEATAMSEQKREKFVKLAEQRVNRTLREIRLIGNLSNRAAYTSTEEDVKKIFRALQKELDAARARFGEGDAAGGNLFRL